LLRDQPSHRKSERVELFNAERVDEGSCVLRHLFNQSRNFAARAGHAGVVKQNHSAVVSKSVGQSRIPVIHGFGKVHEKEQRDVDLCAETAGSNKEFSYPLSHSALPLTLRACLLMTRVGGARDAPGCPAMEEGCGQSTPQFTPHIQGLRNAP
jgi:hypothetical protein